MKNQQTQQQQYKYVEKDKVTQTNESQGKGVQDDMKPKSQRQNKEDISKQKYSNQSKTHVQGQSSTNPNNFNNPPNYHKHSNSQGNTFNKHHKNPKTFYFPVNQNQSQLSQNSGSNINPSYSEKNNQATSNNFNNSSSNNNYKSQTNVSQQQTPSYNQSNGNSSGVVNNGTNSYQSNNNQTYNENVNRDGGNNQNKQQLKGNLKFQSNQQVLLQQGDKLTSQSDEGTEKIQTASKQNIVVSENTQQVQTPNLSVSQASEQAEKTLDTPHINSNRKTSMNVENTITNQQNSSLGILQEFQNQIPSSEAPLVVEIIKDNIKSEANENISQPVEVQVQSNDNLVQECDDRQIGVEKQTKEVIELMEELQVAEQIEEKEESLLEQSKSADQEEVEQEQIAETEEEIKEELKQDNQIEVEDKLMLDFDPEKVVFLNEWVIWICFSADQQNSSHQDEKTFLHNNQPVLSFKNLKDLGFILQKTRLRHVSDFFTFKTVRRLQYDNDEAQLRTIDAISFFKSGIKPIWEDEKNQRGHDLSTKFSGASASEIDEIYFCLLMIMFSEEYPFKVQTNGFRFADKGNTKKSGVRLEIWFDDISADVAANLKDYFTNVIHNKWTNPVLQWKSHKK